MSLMKTLTKVAMGMAQVKQAQNNFPNDLLADADQAVAGFAEATAPFEGQAGLGGLPSILTGLLGGGAGGAGSQLGDLLESLDGDSIQDKLSGLAGKAGAGGVLGSLLGMLQSRPSTSDASFGQVLNSAFDTTPEREIAPSADQEAAAALLLRAMINAAQSDGVLDDRERDKLMGHLGSDIGAEEAAFVQAEILSPVDIDTLVAQTPKRLAPQVYAMSVLGSDVVNPIEAQYLNKLANRLGMNAELINHIHDRLGVPSLYS